MPYYDYGNLSNKKQIKKLINKMQNNANEVLIIATDQEPGKDKNLNNKNGFCNTKTAYELGLLSLEDSTKYIANKVSTFLWNLGINTNFAPVVDLRLQTENVISDRSFGDKPETVILNAKWFIEAFKRKNIIINR